jgi:hypothetical protein
MFQGELKALPYLAFPPDSLTGNDENVLEDLFG